MYFISFDKLSHIGVALLLWIEDQPIQYDHLVAKFGEEAKVAIAEMMDSDRIIITPDGISLNKQAEMTPTEAAFEAARKFYPGTKGGFKTTFAKMKTKHKDWKMCLHKLIPAIEREIKAKEAQRNSGKHCPDWQHFETWINNRGWEKTFDVEVQTTTTNSTVYARYLERKQQICPNAAALPLEDVHAWVNMAGIFSGLEKHITMQALTDRIWAAHGQNTKIEITKLINSIKQK